MGDVQIYFNMQIRNTVKRVHNRALRSRFPAHFFLLIPQSRPSLLGNPDPAHFSITFFC